MSERNRLLPLLVALALAAAIVGVYLVVSAGSDGGEMLVDGCEEVEKPAPKKVDLTPPSESLSGPTTATVQTSCGSFTIELDVERAPKTSASFAHIAREGAYDDTPIHRIEPGFVVQGGDPNGDGTGDAGYSIQEKPPADLVYSRGTVAMAKTGVEPAGTSGSQFFVVTAPDAGLPADYALLGTVTSGYSVVKRIESLGQAGGKPKSPVVIRSVKISSS